MRLKRDLTAIKKSELINLKELSLLSEVPYNTLVQYQRRFQILPTVSIPERKEVLYNREDCVFAIKNFLKLKKKGFKISFIKSELMKTKKRYLEMWGAVALTQ